MTKEIIDTTNKLIRPEDISISDNDVIRQLSENLQDISTEDVNAMCDEMDEAEKMEREQEAKKKMEENKLKKMESIKGNKEMVFDDLRKNYLKFEDRAKVMGYRGKKMHLELPAVGDFEGYKFDCFISNKRHNFRSKLSEKSFSIKEISKLLESLSKYLKELGVGTDGDINYEKALEDSLGKDEYKAFNVLYYLKEITGLSDFYRVVDKTGWGAIDSIEILDYYKRDCCLYWKASRSDVARFLLKVTD